MAKICRRFRTQNGRTFVDARSDSFSSGSICFRRLLQLEDKMNHKPLEMSGCEQQRVALARAIINNPAIILADEPTGNLDTENSQIVLDMFKELNQRLGQTIIMIT